MLNENRLLWLDSAKGIGIIFVVMGHITTDPVLARFIFSFHMPLFFFLSGISYNMSRQQHFIRRRARSLLIPYVLFCLLCFIYWFFLEHHFRPSTFNPTAEFLNIFIAQGGTYTFNSVMWFLPCLFIVETFFYAVRHTVHHKLIRTCIVLACFIVGLALSGTEPFPLSFRMSARLPWMLDTALVSIPFYTLGVALGNFPAITTENRVSILVPTFIGMFALCLVLAVYFPAQTNLAEFILPHPLLFIISSASGIAAVLATAQYIPTSWLQTLGRMSLVIMCIHEPIKRILLKIAEMLSGVGIGDLRGGG